MGYASAIEARGGAPVERCARSRRMLRVQIRGRRFGTRPMVVRDISASGLGGTTEQWLIAGERVEARLPNHGEVPATVAWTDGRRFGLRFDIPIDAERVTRERAGEARFEVMDRFRPEPSTKRPAINAR